jgi:hypothetical protein
VTTNDLYLFARAFGATVVTILLEIGNIPRKFWIAMVFIAVLGNLLAVLLG